MSKRALKECVLFVEKDNRRILLSFQHNLSNIQDLLKQIKVIKIQKHLLYCRNKVEQPQKTTEHLCLIRRRKPQTIVVF